MNDSWCDFLVIYEDEPADMGLLRCVLLYNGCRWDEHARCSDTKKEIRVGEYKGVISMGGGKKSDLSELGWLKTAIQLKKAILGICQGAQNLVGALGHPKLDPVKPRPHEGVKVLLDAHRKWEGDLVLKHLAELPPGYGPYQFHEYAFRLPEDARCLAASHEHSEAFRWKDKLVYGLQFHPEVAADTLDRWAGLQGGRQEYVQIAKVGWNVLNAWVQEVIGPGSGPAP